MPNGEHLQESISRGSFVIHVQFNMLSSTSWLLVQFASYSTVARSSSTLATFLVVSSALEVKPHKMLGKLERLVYALEVRLSGLELVVSLLDSLGARLFDGCVVEAL